MIENIILVCFNVFCVYFLIFNVSDNKIVSYLVKIFLLFSLLKILSLYTLICSITTIVTIAYIIMMKVINY